MRASLRAEVYLIYAMTPWQRRQDNAVMALQCRDSRRRDG